MADTRQCQCTHQIITHRRKRQHTDLEWEAGYRDVAGHMVLGVQKHEAEEKGAGYDTRGKDLKAVDGKRQARRLSECQGLIE